LPVLLRYSTVSLPKSMIFPSDEERADGVAVVDALYRLTEEASHARNLDLLVLSDRLGRRNRVRNEDLADGRVVDALERRPGEDAVAGAGRDRTRTVLHDGAGGLGERAGGVDHVVDNQGVLAADVADEVHDLGYIRCRAAFVDDGEAGVEALGKGTRAF